MNRVKAARVAAHWVGIGAALSLSASVSLGAEAAKSASNEASRVALQQRLEAAQQRLERAAQEVADLSVSLSNEEGATTAATRARSVQRAGLGVVIATDNDEDREEGVEVISVSPGGGAAEAGLRSGDVLLALNNKALKRDDEGSARAKLQAVMRAVKPGEKVTVKYERDGKAKTVELVTKSLSDRTFAYTPRAGRFERFEAPAFFLGGAGGILGKAELVPLTPKLGQYFGTEKGLLVVRAPSDDELELEDGDVILEIDGRTPNSTSHAMRILSSYQPGETLKFTVMRKKRRTDIEVVVPEAPRARLERRMERDIERSLERSLRNLPALRSQSQLRPRGTSVLPVLPPAPPVAPLAPPAPPVTAMAPSVPLPALTPQPPSIEIQPLPDDAIEVF